MTRPGSPRSSPAKGKSVSVAARNARQIEQSAVAEHLRQLKAEFQKRDKEREKR